MPEDAGLWEIRLGIFATEPQADELVEQISRLLCPDPEHPPPCPIPWSVARLEVDVSSGDYAELLEQARTEDGHEP
ncbi:hypothetical protein [Krasilnikovia sp. MM14-A1004]|uniref:hypothetical protein n=1 Tax=Krasilnikovia sp. MM14-A1004 TaxID=3373541 RepID=UPI00399C76B1